MILGSWVCLDVLTVTPKFEDSCEVAAQVRCRESDKEGWKELRKDASKTEQRARIEMGRLAGKE